MDKEIIIKLIIYISLGIINTLIFYTLAYMTASKKQRETEEALIDFFEAQVEINNTLQEEIEDLTKTIDKR